jgi:DNA-binding MarR family transcriptional regulator
MKAPNPSQTKIILCFNPPEEAITQSELTKRTALYWTTITANIKGLIEQGIITKEDKPHTRNKPLRLTNKGKQLWQTIKKIQTILQ